MFSPVPTESYGSLNAKNAGSIRLVHPIFQRCSDISSNAKTQDLANVLWAVSRVACPVPPNLLAELEKRSQRSHLPMVELVACISALAELRNVSSCLWKSVALDASASPRALGTLLWAHGTAKVLPATSLVKMLDVSQMSPQSLANSLWALAKLQVAISSGNIEASQRLLKDELHKFKPQEFANCVWAIGSMEEPAVKFFEHLQLPRLASLEDQHISQAVSQFSQSQLLITLMLVHMYKLHCLALVLILTGFAHRRCCQGKRIKERDINQQKRRPCVHPFYL